MKKNKNYLVIAAIAVGCTAFCSTGITAGLVWASRDKVVRTSSSMTPAEYNAWCDEWSEDGHLYFHYNRGDKGEYDKYALWLWPFQPESLEGTLWGYEPDKVKYDTVTLHPMSRTKMQNRDLVEGGNKSTYIDDYGVIFDVDLYSSSLVGGKTGKSVSFEGAEAVGFLLPNVDSMDGSKNWTSDGGVENYIEDFANEANWRTLRNGKAIHVFVSTGQLNEIRFAAGNEMPGPKVNPIDEDTSGDYYSKTNTILPYSGPKPTDTDDEFKDVGVGYQIFVASFRDSNHDGIGDINGIRQSLDYFEDLGVQCLWLTPVMKCGSYHGYDVIDYTKIDKRFGTMEDFESLLSECHARGIKVLMDLVLNHTSKSNVWFTKSKWGDVDNPDDPVNRFDWRDVYIWKYKTQTFEKANVVKQGDKWVADGTIETSVYDDAENSDNPSWYKDGESNYYYYGKFGSGMPEINYENQKVRDLVIDTAKFWIDKGIDGYRLDAVKHIYMNDECASSGGDTVVIDVGEKSSYDEERGRYVAKKYDYSSNLTKNVNWWREFADKLKTYAKNLSPARDCFLVGENFDGWGTRTSPYYQALDSQFDFSNYYHVPAWIYNTDAGASSFDTTEGNGGQAWETYNAFASDGMFNIGTTEQPIMVQGGCRPDFINGAFTSNHDVMRLINQANGVGNKNKTIANDNVQYNNEWQNGRAKFQAAVTMLNPGLSWIYYGDELGMSSNTYQHIDMYGSENNMDIWYRQPFLWKDKAVRSDYKANQYAFELDAHNKHLLNNDEGIDYREIKDPLTGDVIGHTINTLSTFYPYFKVLNHIKREFPHGAKIEYKYSSQNVLRIDVHGDGTDTRELVIFLNNGINENEYRIMLDNSYSFLDATEGAPRQINGNIGGCLHGVTAFYKGVK